MLELDGYARTEDTINSGLDSSGSDDSGKIGAAVAEARLVQN